MFVDFSGWKFCSVLGGREGGVEEGEVKKEGSEEIYLSL